MHNAQSLLQLGFILIFSCILLILKIIVLDNFYFKEGCAPYNFTQNSSSCYSMQRSILQGLNAGLC